MKVRITKEDLQKRVEELVTQNIRLRDEVERLRKFEEKVLHSSNLIDVKPFGTAIYSMSKTIEVLTTGRVKPF